jgi:hypothetical protein
MAQANPRGMPKRRDPKVTQKEPTIMGRMPNSPWLGTQRPPKRNLVGPIFQMKGIPSPKMKKAIKAKIDIDEKAIKRRSFWMIFSLISNFILLKILIGLKSGLPGREVFEPLDSIQNPEKPWLCGSPLK